MACAVAASLGVVSVARAPRGELVPVVVATRTLAAGSVLSPVSLRLVRTPIALVPEASVESLADATGRRLAGPLTTGEVVTAARLAGTGMLTGQPVGTRALHVTLADTGAAAMLQAGDAVDLVGPQGVVARAVTVLGRDSDPGRSSSGVMGGAALGLSAQASGLVVAVDEPEIEAIARTPVDAMGRSQLIVVLRGG
jgi:Flp pilus assembly protein CpaB